jgi:two-component sensor histidine kinase/CHASE3 domain sensor protein
LRLIPASPLRIGAFLSLAIVALALVGGIAVILRTLAAGQAHREQAVRSSEVLTLLRDVTRDAINAESAQRGYFITLDRGYLEPYQLSRARYRGALRRLHALAERSGDATQPGLVRQIEVLSEAKFAELGESVALIAAGDLNEARRRILTDSGQRSMERLRLTVEQLARNEHAQLDLALGLAVDAERRLVPLLLGLLMLILLALGLALNLALRNAEAEAKAAQAAELSEARDRADLLAGELNHRVKNLFAVVLAIIRMSGRDDPTAKPVAEKIADRVTALLRAQELSQGAGGAAQVSLAKLVDTLLAPYRGEGSVAETDGPECELAARHATPLGLVLHELATNCVKYGAWSSPGGRLEVTWQCATRSDPLILCWREHCSGLDIMPSESRGFGSTLLDGSIRQLGGTLTRTFHSDGIEVLITIPLDEEAASAT